MRRRKRLLALMGLFVVVALPAVYWSVQATMLDNFDRVEPGMTRAEVYALLGRPPTAAGRGGVWHWANRCRRCER
jgi:outer membrane protein assembly factor BamE (lipoprotein component of BamABCDE complex)